jgi:UDP-glucose 4-epimerase
MRTLVTGAGGYIGGGLVGVLGSQGWDVHALLRHPAPYLDVEHTIADLVKDIDALDAACRGVDTVVHLAGENEVLAARDPVSALAGTIVATERLVEAVGRAGIGRLVYLSTVHVYGTQMADGATLTEDLRLEPRATYAISRLASEHVVKTLVPAGVDVVVLRLTNSVGAPAHPSVDRWTLVANDLCRQGVLAGRLELRSSGVQYRDFVSLADVHSIIAAVARPDGAPVPAGVYNLGSGKPMTVRELAKRIQDAFERCTGTRPELHAPKPEGLPPEPYQVSVESAARHGLRAETPIDEAIEDTVNFCIEHRDAIGSTT